MDDPRGAADLDVSDAEIDRLKSKAARRTSPARAAFRAKLEQQALERAVDPLEVFDLDERVARAERLRDELDPGMLDELVKAERARFMAEIGRLSSRERRTRRILRLRRAAGEQQ